MMQSVDRIRDILHAVDAKTGAKHLNLTGAVQHLREGLPHGEIADAPTSAAAGEISIDSGKRLLGLLSAANATTGQPEETITAAVQRMCSGYEAPTPLYTFGVLSDLHLQYVSGVEDFQRALVYLRDRVAFTCICGDLVSYATAEHMAAYKACVDAYAGGMPLHECAGNHESYPALGVAGNVDGENWTQTTGKPLYYTFSHGDDVFIMLSMKSERSSDLFPEGALEWLQTTLEANRDKRCFLFQHAPELADLAADPSGQWSSLMDGPSGKSFLNIIRQYPRVVWFHGHTHVTLGVKAYPVSDRETLGYRSVHVPSLVSPRFFDEEAGVLADYTFDQDGQQIWGSVLAEGYMVDVYAHHIVLRGINFAAGPTQDRVQPFRDEVYVLST